LLLSLYKIQNIVLIVCDVSHLFESEAFDTKTYKKLPNNVGVSFI